MHQRQIDAALQADGSYDYTPCFETVKPWVSSADLAVVNLETPLGGRPYTGYPCFSAPDSYLEALVDAGFDYFLTANNHCLDKGIKGLERTVRQLEKRNLPYGGVYASESERDSIMPRVVDVKGFKIAILNYTYGTNGFKEKGCVKIDRIDRNLIRKDVEKARVKGAELIACCVHWGEEYNQLPNKSQTDLARFLRELGVEMIIGSHPHVVQPMELTRNKEGDKVLTVYSLGNFISGMRTSDTRGGAAVTVRIKRNLQNKAVVDAAFYNLVFVRPNRFQLVKLDVGRKAERVCVDKAGIFAKRTRALLDHNNVNVKERQWTTDGK